MIGFEADLGLLQRVDQPGALVVVSALQAVFDLALEAGELLAVVVVPGPPDGGLEFVEELTQVLFHGQQRYRTSGLYRMRCGWAASAPRRFFRSAS